MFENLLGSEWLPAAPEIHERLLADPPARVADIACGQGRSSIEIARAYPSIVVDGIDSDEASIEAANRNLDGSGVEDRVTFHARDAADADLVGRYDLVTIFEALHDMSYPVEVLRAARGLLGEDGMMLIGDERTQDAFTAPASEVERLYYGFSVFHCLPVGMVGEGAAGTGTVIRADRTEEQMLAISAWVAVKESARDQAVRRGGRLLQLRGPADRARLLALLPPQAVTAASAKDGLIMRIRTIPIRS